MKTWKKLITALATGALIFTALSQTAFGQTMNIEVIKTEESNKRILTVKVKELNIADGNISCNDSDELYRITGTSNKNYITVSGGTAQAPIQVDLVDASIDLHRVNDNDSIAASPLTIKPGSYAIIYIGKENANAENLLYGGNDTGSGTNEGYAGISIEDGATVTIAGQGKLTAHGGGEEYGGAGIGGNNSVSVSNITIQSGTIIATGAHGAAGIGGGRGGKSSNITIEGGNITATGGKYAPGIGPGHDVGAGDGGSRTGITILNGTVNAKGGYHAAGIGGSEGGKISNITIDGGVIYATGGENGAGIGGGSGGIVDNVTIRGGTVEATGGNGGGAGIGGGSDGAGKTVTITGGNVKATGSSGGADIGAGAGNSSNGTLQNANGDNVYLTTLTLDGAEANTPIASLKAIGFSSAYGIKDVKTIDANKLYIYLPAGTTVESILTAETPARRFTNLSGTDITVADNYNNTGTLEFAVSAGVQTLLDINKGNIVIGNGTVSGYGSDGSVVTTHDPDG